MTLPRPQTPEDLIPVTVIHGDGTVETAPYKVPRRLSHPGTTLLIGCHDGITRCVVVKAMFEEKAG